MPLCNAKGELFITQSTFGTLRKESECWKQQLQVQTELRAQLLHILPSTKYKLLNIMESKMERAGCCVPDCRSGCVSQFATLTCGHLLCKKHTPSETELNEGRSKARCGMCGVDKEIKQWSLACGCIVSKLDGFEVIATREGSKISLLRVRCQKKHEMLVSNIKWLSSRYAYNAILSYLSEVLKDASITTFDFNCDEVGDEGAEAIANALMNLHYKLITLNLWSSGISDKGTMSMVLRNENCRLTKLELGDNDISEELLKSTYRILEENKIILFRSQLLQTSRR